MKDMTYLKKLPVTVIGAGAVGKAIAADTKLSGQNVRLYHSLPRGERVLFNVDRTGIELNGKQRNLYNFKRSGVAKLDMVTTDISEAMAGAGIITVALPAFAHEETFRDMIPHLEDGQVIHIFTSNFGTLLFRKLMREMNCTKDVIIGGWTSSPFGTRIETVGGFTFPNCTISYRAITLRGAAIPMTDSDAFIESANYLGCLDAMTSGDGAIKGDTVLDIGFSNVNPVIHVPATVLGVSTMENWGKIFGDYDSTNYSMYSHALSPSICEVQYKFYNEEIALADEIGVDLGRYDKEDFFSRRSILALEYMGKANMHLPLDEPSPEGNVGPDSVYHRYITEDVPVGCKIYHELGKAYNVNTPVIDSMIVLASAMVGENYFEKGYTLEYLGINDMSKAELLSYLNDGEVTISSK